VLSIKEIRKLTLFNCGEWGVDNGTLGQL